MNRSLMEERVQRMEDLDAIRDLTARHSFTINGPEGQGCPCGCDASIFTEDARWGSKAMKVPAEGIDELMKAFWEQTEHSNFSMHSYTNPIIKLDGDHAIGN